MAAHARGLTHASEMESVVEKIEELQAKRVREYGGRGGYTKTFYLQFRPWLRKLAFLQKDASHMLADFVDVSSSGESIEIAAELMRAAALDVGNARPPIGQGAGARARQQGAAVDDDVTDGAANVVGGMLAGNVFRAAGVNAETKLFVDRCKRKAGKLTCPDTAMSQKLHWDPPPSLPEYNPKVPGEHVLASGLIWRPEKTHRAVTGLKNLPCPIHGFCSAVTGQEWLDPVPVICRGRDDWMLRSRGHCSLCQNVRTSAPMDNYDTSKEKLVRHRLIQYGRTGTAYNLNFDRWQYMKTAT